MFDFAPALPARDRDEHPIRALDRRTAAVVRQILLQLANEQEEAAASEAAATPYWKACPVSVLGSRAAAEALRSAAEAMPANLPNLGV